MSRSRPKMRFRLWLLGGLLTALLAWVLFFDSHSVLKRYQWHQELDALTEENAELRREIQQLQTQLESPLSDRVVERIAREEYGMKRPGETVYHVAPE